MVPVRDRLLPAFAACVGVALGVLAPPVGCAMAPSDGRSISSGSMPGLDVAAALRLGAGLALDDGRPDCVGAAVAFGFTTDGARPVAPSLGAELGCAPGACVGSAVGADDVSGAGATVGPALGSGAELGVGAAVGSVLGAVVGSGAGALLGSGAALGSGAEDGAGACVGLALGAADGAGFSDGAAEGAAVGDGVGLGSGCF